MTLYASLVDDRAVRDAILARIRNEFDLAKDCVSALLGSAPAERRPHLLKTLEMRAAGLAWLHREQVRLLAAWRVKPDVAKRFHVVDHKKTIRDRRNRAFVKVKTFDMKVMTGSKPIGVLIDELHAWARSTARRGWSGKSAALSNRRRTRSC